MSNRDTILVPIAPGELVDKLTILQIKSQSITDPIKRQNVDHELTVLTQVKTESLPPSESLQKLTSELREVNQSLWNIEDEIRICERDQDFGSRFVELARQVYRTNDVRCAIKKQINELLGSSLVEEKQYVDYDRDIPCDGDSAGN